MIHGDSLKGSWCSYGRVKKKSSYMGHTELLLCSWAAGPFLSVKDCQSWNSRKTSVCALSKSTHPPALQHCDRFRCFPNRTEQHPWMESFISWYAVQLSCPAHIPVTSALWDGCGLLVRCTQSAGSHDTHSELLDLGSLGTRLCRDTALRAQAGLAVAILRDMVNVM